jgi:hypothetical protein
MILNIRYIHTTTVRPTFRKFHLEYLFILKERCRVKCGLSWGFEVHWSIEGVRDWRLLFPR